MLGVGGRRRWERGNVGRRAMLGDGSGREVKMGGRWWEAEGMLEKVGETEKIVSKERCKYTVN